MDGHDLLRRDKASASAAFRLPVGVLLEALDSTGERAQFGARLVQLAPQVTVRLGGCGVGHDVAAWTRRGNAFVAQALEGALCRGEGHPVRFGQLAPGGQAVADRELAGSDSGADVLGPTLERGAWVLGRCHATRLRPPPVAGQKGHLMTLVT